MPPEFTLAGALYVPVSLSVVSDAPTTDLGCCDPAVVLVAERHEVRRIVSLWTLRPEAVYMVNVRGVVDTAFGVLAERVELQEVPAGLSPGRVITSFRCAPSPCLCLSAVFVALVEARQRRASAH
jgi:hypothetical protein